MCYTTSMFDLAIIGSGAAGLSAALTAVRSGLKVGVFGLPTSEIDVIENYPGIPSIGGQQFLDTLRAQVERFSPQGGELFPAPSSGSVDFIPARVKFLDKRDVFHIDGYTARAVIYAAGCHHKKLGIPGENLASYCAMCDGAYYVDREVCVVGGGDSALNEALYLSKIARKVTIFVRGKLRAQKITIDKALETKNISILYGTTVKEIIGKDKIEGVLIYDQDKKERVIKTDGVFILIGLVANTSLVDMLPEEGGFLLTDERMATIIPGLFVAGDVRSKPLRQVVTAVSDGAIAAISALEYLR